MARPNQERYVAVNRFAAFYTDPLESAFLEIGSLRGKKVLVLGCGDSAAVEESLVNERASVFAVDISRDALIEARKRQENVVYLCADAASLPFASGIFDATISVSTLQYMVIDEVFGECRRVLRTRGAGIFIENLEFCPMAKIHRFFRYIRRDQPPSNLRILRHLRTEDLKVLRLHFSSIRAFAWHDWTPPLYLLTGRKTVLGEIAQHLVKKQRRLGIHTVRGRLAWLIEIVATK